jgi:hypothetical protein
MKQTVQHLVRSCNYPFKRKVLVVDTAPLNERFKNRDIAPLSALYKCCHELVSNSVIDEYKEICYRGAFRQQAYQKHFGCDMTATHDYRGYPILGTVSYIEQAAAPYLVHFDSDVLLHQSPNFNWIQRGIELMQSDERIICVLPLPGPPTSDGTLHQFVDFVRRPEGFFEFKFFTSRLFLIDVRRFQSLLPLPLLSVGPQQNQVRTVVGEVALTMSQVQPQRLQFWEEMVTARIKDTPYVRADLADPGAWSLHALDHGPEFVSKLPDILAKVEQGVFPIQQAGHYDLELSFWN